MHIRSALVITDNSTAVHQGRLHALTRGNHTPGFFDLERIASSATSLHVSQAENRIALQAIGYVIEAREAAAPGANAPAALRAPLRADHRPFGPVARVTGSPGGSEPAGARDGPPPPLSGQAEARWWASPIRAPTTRASLMTCSGGRLRLMGIRDVSAHDAGQLLHRHLNTSAIRYPLLHHGLLLRPSAGLRANPPLSVRDHHGVAHGPGPAGGEDLVLQPCTVPPSAHLRHSGPPLVPVRPVTATQVRHQPPSIHSVGRRTLADRREFAHGRRHPPGNDYDLRCTPCQRTGVGKTAGHRRDRRTVNASAALLPATANATVHERRWLSSDHCAAPVLDLLHALDWSVVETPEANVHATSPDGHVYVGWLPEDPTAWRRHIVWEVRVQPAEGDFWAQEFGIETPSEVVAGFLAALVAHSSR